MDKYDFFESAEYADDEQTQLTDRKIFTENSEPTIEVLQSRYLRGKLDLQPDFQRQYVWDTKQASRLVESTLLGVPIPPIYLSEEPDGSV